MKKILIPFPDSNEDNCANLKSLLKDLSKCYLNSISLKNYNLGDDLNLIFYILMDKKLSKLDLSEINISHMSLISLKYLLKYNKNIKYLNLSNNYIGNDESIKIIASLFKYKHLISIDLSYNQIDDSKIEFLLNSCISLESLNLGFNNFENQGLCQIGEFLKGNSTLKKLILDGNRINDIGSNYLMKGLIENKSLEYLSLKDNIIRREGTLKICKALSKNNTLRELYLQNNDIGKGGVDYILKLLKSRKSDYYLKLIINYESTDIQTNEKLIEIKNMLDKSKSNKENEYNPEDDDLSIRIIENYFDDILLSKEPCESESFVVLKDSKSHECVKNETSLLKKYLKLLH